MVGDDPKPFAEALADTFRERGFRVAVACGQLTRDDLIGLARSFRPGVVLLDLHLRQQGLAIGVVPDLSSLGAWVLALTDGHDRYLVAEALEAGVRGVVAKSDSLQRVAHLVDDTIAATAM